MFKWEKLGKLFDPRDYRGQSWMKEFAQSPSTLVFDDRVRVYFCSRPPPASDGQYMSYVAYIDVDRNDPRMILKVCEKPVLSLGALGTFDEFGTYPVSVIRSGDEIRAYYAGWTRCESVPFNAAIGMAVSSDGGDSFVRLGDGPVLSYSPDEPFLLGSPRVRRYGNKWYLWYVAGKRWISTPAKPEPVYKIRMASSDDGIDWTKFGTNLIEDRLGANECQACPDVTYRGGRYHMFFSYRDFENYKGKTGGYRIGYAVSEDMIHWSRQDELAGLGVSDSGWDSEMACYPHVFDLDGKTFMLYQGNGMGRDGMGLAQLLGTGDWSAQ